MYNAIMGFLDSNLFAALLTSVVTFGAGATAFVVYFRQKEDTKRDAANVVLLEVQNAERKIKNLRDVIAQTANTGYPDGKLPEDLVILPTASWDKYKYFFVRAFNRDEWDSVTDFYNKCRLLDEGLRHNKSFFQKNEEQLRANRLRILMEYLKASIDEDDADRRNSILQKKQAFDDSSIDVSFFYDPRKPLLDVKKILADLVVDLSLTTVGSKLRQLAQSDD